MNHPDFTLFRLLVAGIPVPLHYIEIIQVVSGSSGATLNKLQSVFAWAMKILNILVVLGAVYAGANIANSMFGLGGDDHYSGKGKGKLLALVFGLIIWFGIQVIIGDIGTVMK